MYFNAGDTHTRQSNLMNPNYFDHRETDKYATSDPALSQEGKLMDIYTLQLNFLSSDWFFSKYSEYNVQCTPRTTPRLREVILLHDR